MGDKQRKRDLVTAFLREVVPPAGVEVQVYRYRQDRKKPPEYLGWLESEREVELEFLEAASRDDLLDLIPFPKTKRLWGGGDYQFRFFWRDDEGRKELKPRRSRDKGIGGKPKPKR